MSNQTTRRRVLQCLGVTAIGGIAGCNSTGETTITSGPANDDATTAETRGPGTRTATSRDTTAGDQTSTVDQSTDNETATRTSIRPRVRTANLSPNTSYSFISLRSTNYRKSVQLPRVSFEEVSEYMAVSAGEWEAVLEQNGMVVYSDPDDFERRSDYTVAIVGTDGRDTRKGLQITTFRDDNSPVGEEKARLRVIHASPDAPPVDLVTDSGDTVLFDGLSYLGAEYVTVQAGDYSVQVRSANDETDGGVVTDLDLSLDGGAVYTAFATGYVTPGDDPATEPFDVLVTRDSETSR